MGKSAEFYRGTFIELGRNIEDSNVWFRVTVPDGQYNSPEYPEGSDTLNLAKEYVDNFWDKHPTLKRIPNKQLKYESVIRLFKGDTIDNVCC